ncbi:hypothetical protein MTO96_008764 [Rhipicephalus appendiculatus]
MDHSRAGPGNGQKGSALYALKGPLQVNRDTYRPSTCSYERVRLRGSGTAFAVKKVWDVCSSQGSLEPFMVTTLSFPSLSLSFVFELSHSWERGLHKNEAVDGSRYYL